MRRLALLLVFCLHVSCDKGGSGAIKLGPTPPHLRVPTSFQKGIALGLYYEHKERPYEVMLDEIAATGADHVEFVLHWTQKDIRATQLSRHPVDTVKDDRLLQAMDYAHRVGLRVFLFPIIDIAHREKGEWRGTLAPTDWDAWWKSYSKFVMHYASLAEKGGAALFSVGSELVSTETKRERWETLIKEVRKVFHGKLIYSANWDHYRPVVFWDLLDYAGMTGYYVLSATNEPKYNDLVAAWKKIKKDILSWQKTLPIPLVFTELGYPSQDGANQHPWDYTKPDPVDLEEQLLCYQAFREVWEDEENLGGIYFWNWYEPGGPNDKTYSPRGKPAEKVIKEWFQRKNPASKKAQ